MASARTSYGQSCDLLRTAGWFDAADPLPLPSSTPRTDDDPPFGVRFFRTRVDGADGVQLSGLTLPRAWILRSHVGPVSFANTDLSESSLCWNDFDDVDLTDADLSRADLRASTFTRVRFVRAMLAGADLRHATFIDCDFDGADCRGAKLGRRELGGRPTLAREQLASINWRPDAGPLPDGG